MAANADRFTEMAGRHLEWIKTGQADSVLAHATPQVKAQLPAAMVQAIWKQLLTQGAAERFHIIAPSAMKTLVKVFHLQKGPDGSGYYNGNTAFRPR